MQKHMTFYTVALTSFIRYIKFISYSLKENVFCICL